MATTYKETTTGSNNTQKIFDYPFPALKTEDVKVALNGVTQTTGYTATLSPAQVEFDTAPGDGIKVRVYRDTDVDSPKAVYAAGSSIRALDLNNNHDQLLYALQEEQNQLGDFGPISIRDGKLTISDAVYTDGVLTNNYLKIGSDDNGLRVYTNTGGDSYISEVGSGSLAIASNGTNLYIQKNTSGSEAFINCIADSEVRIFWNNQQKFATKSNGVDITGTIIADAATIDGNLTATGTSTLNGNLVVTGTISDSGGNLELADDVDISGDLSLVDDKKIYLGSSDDAYLYWKSSWGSRLEISSNEDIYYLAGSGDSHYFKVNNSGVLALQEDGIYVHEHILPGIDNQRDIGASDKEFKDLYIDGTGYIDTVSADDITGSAIVTSGTSTSDTKVYSAKRSDALYFAKASGEEIASGETWVADDNKIATTAAIDARIVDLVDDVGGFVPIANETSFPHYNPDVNNDSGTLVSVPLANNVTSNGSGVISIPNGTMGNATVTINGADNNTTYTQGFGIIVETTPTLHSYNFHRYVPKATEVTTVAGSIANVNTTAGAIANVNTVAGISSNVTTVAGIASNVTTVANDGTDIGTVAGISSNVTTVAGISSNVTSVAGNATNINTCATNISAITDASTQATNAATSATNAASSATTASTQATNAASSATSAASSATTATTQASTATTQASNASTSAANALAYRNTTLTYRNDASAILTQVESAPYNLADNVSSHTAWGDITDTGANAVFTNESSNILLTMAEGSSSYNYGSIT